MRKLDVKEIHGYEKNRGLKLLKTAAAAREKRPNGRVGRAARAERERAPEVSPVVAASAAAPRAKPRRTSAARHRTTH